MNEYHACSIILLFIWRSFAYYTIQERLPIILTKVIDYLSREKESIAEQYNGDVCMKMYDNNNNNFQANTNSQFCCRQLVRMSKILLQIFHIWNMKCKRTRNLHCSPVQVDLIVAGKWW